LKIGSLNHIVANQNLFSGIKNIIGRLCRIMLGRKCYLSTVHVKK
jgi:hypothetical protein